LLTMGGKTGTLFVSRGDITKEIYFKEGNVIYATSSAEEDMLENVILKKNMISQEQLNECKKVQEMTQQNLASTLVYLNLLPKDQIAALVKSQVEEIIYDIFDWIDGEFEFRENELPDTEYMISALNTMNILMEGTRRLDEWTQIRNKMPSGNTVLSLSPKAFSQHEDVKLNAEEAQVLSLLDGERSIEEIREKSVLGELATSRAIYGLLMAGFVQKLGKKESKKMKIAEQEELLGLLSKIYQPALEIISDTFVKKMGRGGGKKFILGFRSVSEKYPVLNYINITDDNKIKFINFIEMVKKLPAESRIHQVSSGLASLLEAEFNELTNIFGSRIGDEVYAKIDEIVQPYLTDYKDFFQKYGVYNDIKRTLDR
ncbi:DUF4388 domain-containing protein, partial [bacterium]|nr:DUF4388 domain-containing protein [bacterium]